MDTIRIVAGYRSEVAFLDPAGRTTRRVAIPWRAEPLGDAVELLEAELRRREERFFLQLLREIPPTDKVPTVAGLLVDDQGFTWVKAYDPRSDALWLKRHTALEIAPGGEWWVLSKKGVWVAKVEMPNRFVPLDFAKNRVLGILRDTYDVESVVIHRVEVEGPPREGG